MPISPPSIIGVISYQGTWNANTNTPTLASGVGIKGHFYVVSVSGATNLDGLSSWNVGDWAIFNGSAWGQVDGGASEVLSVAGKTGAVVLDYFDITGNVTADSGDITSNGSGVLTAEGFVGDAGTLSLTGDDGSLTLQQLFTGTNNGDFSVAMAANSATTIAVLVNGQSLSFDNPGAGYVSGTVHVLDASNGNYLGMTDGSVSGIASYQASGVLSVAVAGTDYLTPTGNGSGLTGVNTKITKANTYSATGTATTAFVVSIGSTLADTNYTAVITPRNTLSSAVFNVSTKTTSTFTVTYLAGLTGTVAFDWALIPW